MRILRINDEPYRKPLLSPPGKLGEEESAAAGEGDEEEKEGAVQQTPASGSSSAAAFRACDREADARRPNRRRVSMRSLRVGGEAGDEMYRRPYLDLPKCEEEEDEEYAPPERGDKEAGDKEDREKEYPPPEPPQS